MPATIKNNFFAFMSSQYILMACAMYPTDWTSTPFTKNIEVTPSGISKASAIQDLQKRYQIPKERTISFGDGKNDLEMFSASGISVAMANASEEVKKHATHQTLTNKQSGIGYFLSNYFNLKENNHEGTDHVELHQPRTAYFT